MSRHDTNCCYFASMPGAVCLHRAADDALICFSQSEACGGGTRPAQFALAGIPSVRCARVAYFDGDRGHLVKP
ncbi:Uncharacterised protein [Mycobacteroides abscessus subsp. abscessus]|nr:Uncharacterised protein [Mycobacteroides abscessus subsp. abscessus]